MMTAHMLLNPESTQVCVSVLLKSWRRTGRSGLMNTRNTRSTTPSVLTPGLQWPSPRRGRMIMGGPSRAPWQSDGEKMLTHTLAQRFRSCVRWSETLVSCPTDGDRSSNRDNLFTVEFGKLFKHYLTISNKLVGVLLRARKQRQVDFEGEMLWQGKDDHVVITLLWPEMWIYVDAMVLFLSKELLHSSKYYR